MNRTHIRRWLLIAAGLTVLVVASVWLGKQPPEREAHASTTDKSTSDSVVTLDSTARRLAGIELISVATGSANELTVNGTITFDADRVSVIAPRADGRLMRMHADLGERVTEGQRLATVESAEISQIRGDLERSRAAADIAKRNYEREKRLYEQNISPQKEMLDAEGLYRTAEADVRSAEAKLRTYGATVGQGGSFELSSPIAGTVVERSASPGQIVGPQTNLFTVADLSRVWITIDVYEADFGRLRADAPVTVIPVALPNASFRGRVRSMGGVVDTTTHTFKVRVVVENPGQQLRPGMFAQVRIEVPGDPARGTSVVVPELAVQDVNDAPAVFVATADPSRFVVRRITVGTRTGNGAVAVTRGLSPQDRIVTMGAFQLKAELMKSSFSEPE